MKKRYLTNTIVNDLNDKMVFVAGPRQVGKTTLAKHIGKHHFSPSSYLNWDYQPDRRKIIKAQFEAVPELLIFDEVHKYKHWKNHLKGIFDTYGAAYKILVTGSSRLDIYRRGGDSLRGRYYYHVLHPFSLAELLGIVTEAEPFQELNFSSKGKFGDAFGPLLKFGPFPEPFLKQSETFLRRWQIEEAERLVKEEIRDLRKIVDISSLQILVDTLPNKVGSLLSINNLREDIQTAHKTMVNYLQVLELFYYHFRLYPFARKNIRSLKKMAKLYLWDWSVVKDKAAKMENMVASHLLKFTHFLHYTKGYKTELWYLRDADGREVDFLVTVAGKPWFAVEVKTNNLVVSPTLSYFAKRLSIPLLYQAVLKSGVDFRQNGVRVISIDKFLSGLI
jgi:uncharacterized protein